MQHITKSIKADHIDRSRQESIEIGQNRSIGQDHLNPLSSKHTQV